MKILEKAREDELAMTKKEIIRTARFNWFSVAPVGEGGILLSIVAAAIDRELGVSKEFDEHRYQALAELVKECRVIERESDGETYYWLAA